MKIKPRSFFLAALLALQLPFPAQANTLYKCTDASGVVLYTNQRTSKKDCIVLSQMQTSAAASSAPATASRSRSLQTPTPGDFPRISGNEQKARDSDRRAILDKELANEQQNLEKAKKAASDAANQPSGQLQPLRDTIALHERNVAALKKELGSLR